MENIPLKLLNLRRNSAIAMNFAKVSVLSLREFFHKMDDATQEETLLNRLIILKTFGERYFSLGLFQA